MHRPVRSGGLTWIEVVVVILVVLGFALPILVPAYQRERIRSIGAECSRQLSDIDKAMLSYANDYDGAFPLAGGKGTKWGPGLRSWSNHSRAEAFGLDPNSAGGEATIGASLYLLVRHDGLSPKSFVCPADRRVTEFRPQKYGVTNRGLTDVWDFGPDPARHCSYAYHMPYGRYALTTSNEPSFAVAADRSPWMDSPSTKAGDFAKFVPDVPPFEGTPEQAHLGNTITHSRRGQTVLFIDGHTEFALRAFAGLEDDNIYTSWDGADRIRGTPPKLGSQPANTKDSLLVNDPPSITHAGRR